MFRFMKTLKFQIGIALMSLIAVFVYFSMHTMNMLEEQRSHGALLRLAGELQVTIQHMAMQALNYRENAPQDKASYSRDLQLYYQDLMDNTHQFGSVCQAFASGDFNQQQMPGNLSMRPILSAATMDAAYALEVYWNDYLKDLKQQLGASDMPKLAHAAEFIVNSNIELSNKTEDLLSALDSDIKHRTMETGNIIRISFIVAILLSGGIMLWFYVQVLRPLDRSVRGFQKVANGNFGYQVETTEDNEIGWLTQSFNQLSARIGSLFELTTRLQEGSDLNQTLQFVSRTFPELLPLDWVGVLFVTNDNQIQLEAAYSDGQPEDLGLLRFSLSNTLLAQCLESGESLHIPDIKEVALLNPNYRFLHVLVDRKRRDAIFLPVTGQSPVPVVLVFASRRPHAYQREHLELLSRLALVISLSFGRTIKLAEHARLAAIGEFASGIAHEIRTPLATVSMALDYFSNADLSESAEKRAALATTEMSRINHLLEEMLLYAKPLSLNMEKFGLSPLLQDVISSQQKLAQAKSVNIQLHSSTDLPSINADKDRLMQIFINLVRNAIDAATAGSEVAITANTAGSNPNILQIRVHNQGQVIREEQLKQIFEPFFTTKAAGTGLGLSIVRRLVLAHGGQIDVSSTEQDGTCFSVKLPRVA
jgi:signal transduction histidine kinase/HAMP domain-containing protein